MYNGIIIHVIRIAELLLVKNSKILQICSIIFNKNLKFQKFTNRNNLLLVLLLHLHYRQYYLLITNFSFQDYEDHLKIFYMVFLLI